MAATAARAPRPGTATAAAVEQRYAAVLSSIGLPAPGVPSDAVAQATAAIEQAGETEATAAQQAGIFLPGQKVPTGVAVPAASVTDAAASPVQPLGTLRQADLLVVAPAALPATVLARIRRLGGVTAADLLDAARIKVNGGYVATLGVDPSTFREFAAKPTAESTRLWQNVADGGIAVSYLMGKQEKLPLGGSVTVVGARTEKLPVGGFGTVGISGVDAVVSDAVARSLGQGCRRSAARRAGGRAGTVADRRLSGRGRRDVFQRSGPDDRADPRLPGRGAEPGRHAVRLGRRRSRCLRLLGTGAVVNAPGRDRDAAGRRRSGADWPAHPAL
jgi:hypothetical protein